MQYALVDDLRCRPRPRMRGFCQICGEPCISKCGPKVTWHWAHIARTRCDAWWENETPWHREWKSRFPEDWRERVHIDPNTGEKHIADIEAENGLIIEFQNSPIELDELRSREEFYGNMIWVVNGLKFQRQFHILDPLPDPGSTFSQDLVFWPQRIDKAGRCFWRPSENPDADDNSLVRIHSCSEIENEIWENYVGHHHFHWNRPRTVWLESERPVFIDFGDDHIYFLDTYDKRGLRCVQKFGRQRVEYLAHLPAERVT